MVVLGVKFKLSHLNTFGHVMDFLDNCSAYVYIYNSFFNACQQMVKLPSMLADRPLELHVGSAPALSDTRGKQPKPRKSIGALMCNLGGLF